MKGLIIKDIYALKKSIMAIVLLGLFYIVMAITNRDGNSLISIMLLILPMFSVTSFYYDDMTKWDSFAVAMPLKKSQIVLSKYTLSALLLLAGVAYIVFSMIVVWIFKGESQMAKMVIPTVMALSAGMIFTGVMMPLIYKFGIEKGRMMMIVFAMIFGALIGLVSAGMGIKQSIVQNLNLLALGVFAVSLITFIASYKISVKLYEKKEF